MIKVIKESFSGALREILEVTIEQGDYDLAALKGFKRHLQAVVNGNTRRDGTKATWDDDINGALGEYIASLGLEREWNYPGGVGQPDLVGGIEVRTIMSNDRRLLVKSKDKDDSPFVLVVGTRSHLVWKITGYIYGNEAKKTVFQDPTGPYYLVDQAFLHPILRLRGDHVLPIHQ